MRMLLVVKNENVPFVVRQEYIKLLIALYIDREPNENVQACKLAMP